MRPYGSGALCTHLESPGLSSAVCGPTLALWFADSVLKYFLSNRSNGIVTFEDAAIAASPSPSFYDRACNSFSRSSNPH